MRLYDYDGFRLASITLTRQSLTKAVIYVPVILAVSDKKNNVLMRVRSAIGFMAVPAPNG
jgi:hypothetical protein